MIGIVDYGMGNIRAFANVYQRLNVPLQIITHPDDLESAQKLILPGVGNFSEAMELLKNSGMQAKLNEMVLKRRIPLLGICLGMQMLGRSSEEGALPGLGWIDGETRRLNVSGLPYKTRLPHTGWNEVLQKTGHPLFKGLPPGAPFYFLHSYHLHCNRPEDVIGKTDYGGMFSCAVNSENVFGVQFHPEKSHSNGVMLLKNFAGL